MTFDPMSVEVTCVTLPKDHQVVSKSHDNTSMYVDTVINFVKYHIHTHTTYIHTTYYVQNEWSHSLLLNSVQARQKCNSHMQNCGFLCSSDNFLLKRCNCFLFFFLFFFFLKPNIARLKKRAIFDLLFTLFNHQGKSTKIPSANISLTYIHIFCSPYWLFCLPNFAKKCELIMYGFSLVPLLVLILIRTILEQSIINKMVS